MVAFKKKKQVVSPQLWNFLEPPGTLPESFPKPQSWAETNRSQLLGNKYVLSFFVATGWVGSLSEQGLSIQRTNVITGLCDVLNGRGMLQPNSATEGKRVVSMHQPES